ncbi:hypothetical protein BSKO_10280 [Bryopsis sp. KO-2023]|nr:hypothetical protein BSKO_10280 [Bryopsis sp. KO-2023]
MIDIAVRDAGWLTPEDLWKDFISTRTPVLIKGHIKDDAWSVPKRWKENAYLNEKAGNVTVKVEKRGGAKEKFGKGRKMAMNFGEFLGEIAEGDETLYLSPQEACVGVDGLPELISPPLDEFKGDFPFRPELMGNLVPHQINIWMGNARNGSSSGLHHDFHDNLYILVKGKKRFKLFSPEKAHRMYTVGKIAEVHKNGRIIYETEKPTLSDGSLVEAFEEFQKMKAAKEALIIAEAEQDEEAMEKAEEELDALMEKSLDGFFDDVEGNVEEEDSSGDDKKPKSDEVEVDEEDPSNFSKVDLSLSRKALKKKFPKFPRDAACCCAEVEEGNMLYLPAGWFHEVTSFNMDDSSNGHIAFNYWFHPPNNLEAEKSEGFEKPYVSDYWASTWANRMLDVDEKEDDHVFPPEEEEDEPERPKKKKKRGKKEKKKKKARNETVEAKEEEVEKEKVIEGGKKKRKSGGNDAATRGKKERGVGGGGKKKGKKRKNLVESSCPEKEENLGKKKKKKKNLKK